MAGAALAALVVVAALREGGKLEALGLIAFDVVASGAGAAPRQEHGVIIVGITELDIARYGWPLPDTTLDRTLGLLREKGAWVVALDIYRASVCSPGPLFTWTGDTALTVIFAEKLGLTASDAVPAPACAPPDRVGFTDVVPDDDQTIRRTLFISEVSDSTRLSLGYQAALHRLGREGIAHGVSASGLPVLGRWTMAPFEGSDGDYVRSDAAGYQMLIAGAPRAADIPIVSLSALLGGPAGPIGRGSTVLVGATAPSLPDLQRLGGVSRLPDPVPGVHVHALAAAQAIHLGRGDDGTKPVRTLPEWLEWTYLVAASLFGGWSALSCSSLRRLAVAVVGGALILALVARLGMAFSWWVPLVQPALALLLSGAGSVAVLAALERRDRANLMDLFSRHVSPQIADEIWRRRSEFTVDGRPRPTRLPVTVLFADMRGYTSVAERLEPDALMKWLNTFMSAMADEVIRHGGVVDDYAGDGIKADFGVPFSNADMARGDGDAVRAIRCALGMCAVLRTLNDRWGSEGMPPVAMRIGVASGTAVAGSLGSQRRLKYTVVGDVVNLAARLESLDAADADFSIAPGRVLIDHATYAMAGGEFECRSLGPVRVKGKEMPVEVYQVGGVRCQSGLVRREQPVP